MNTLALGYGSQTGSKRLAPAADILALARVWYGRARQRRQLKQLSKWQLDDLGISQNQARQEAAKPFWQA